jgi:hypothetical protein
VLIFIQERILSLMNTLGYDPDFAVRRGIALREVWRRFSRGRDGRLHCRAVLPSSSTTAGAGTVRTAEGAAYVSSAGERRWAERERGVGPELNDDEDASDGSGGDDGDRGAMVREEEEGEEREGGGGAPREHFLELSHAEGRRESWLRFEPTSLPEARARKPRRGRGADGVEKSDDRRQSMNMNMRTKWGSKDDGREGEEYSLVPQYLPLLLKDQNYTYLYEEGGENEDADGDEEYEEDWEEGVVSGQQERSNNKDNSGLSTIDVPWETEVHEMIDPKAREMQMGFPGFYLDECAPPESRRAERFFHHVLRYCHEGGLTGTGSSKTAKATKATTMTMTTKEQARQKKRTMISVNTYVKHFHHLFAERPNTAEKLLWNMGWCRDFNELYLGNRGFGAGAAAHLGRFLGSDSANATLRGLDLGGNGLCTQAVASTGTTEPISIAGRDELRQQILEAMSMFARGLSGNNSLHWLNLADNVLWCAGPTTAGRRSRRAPDSRETHTEGSIQHNNQYAHYDGGDGGDGDVDDGGDQGGSNGGDGGDEWFDDLDGEGGGVGESGGGGGESSNGRGGAAVLVDVLRGLSGHPSLRSVDLSGNGFGPSAALHINRILLHGQHLLSGQPQSSRLPGPYTRYGVLTNLKLSRNPLGDAGARAIVRMRPMPNNTAIRAAEVQARTASRRSASGALGLDAAALRKLPMGDGRCQLTREQPDGWEEVQYQSYHEEPGEAQYDPCRYLRVLDVSDCGIRRRGAAAIARALSSWTFAVTHLDLSNNMIGWHGAESLAQALRNNDRLLSLKLCRTGLGVKEGGPEGAPTSRDSGGSAKLIGTLGYNFRLSALDLSHNGLDATVGHALAARLACRLDNTSCRGLTALNIAGNPLGVGGAEAMLRSLAKNRVLSWLDMSDTISGQRSVALAALLGDVLQRNTSITSLRAAHLLADVDAGSVSAKMSSALEEGREGSGVVVDLDLTGVRIDFQALNGSYRGGRSGKDGGSGSAGRGGGHSVGTDVDVGIGNGALGGVADNVINANANANSDHDNDGDCNGDDDDIAVTAKSIEETAIREATAAVAQAVRALQAGAAAVGLQPPVRRPEDGDYRHSGAAAGCLPVAVVPCFPSRPRTASSSLLVLDLSGQCLVATDGVLLAGFIASGCSHVESLDLSHNHLGLGIDASRPSIIPGREHDLRRLKKQRAGALGRATRVTRIGLVALARSLETCRCLQSLNLSHNYVAFGVSYGDGADASTSWYGEKAGHASTEGGLIADALGRALARNSTVRKLRLDNIVGLPRHAAAVFAEALAVNATLRTLSLSGNHLGVDDAPPTLGGALLGGLDGLNGDSDEDGEFSRDHVVEPGVLFSLEALQRHRRRPTKEQRRRRRRRREKRDKEALLRAKEDGEFPGIRALAVTLAQRNATLLRLDLRCNRLPEDAVAEFVAVAFEARRGRVGCGDGACGGDDSYSDDAVAPLASPLASPPISDRGAALARGDTGSSFDGRYPPMWPAVPRHMTMRHRLPLLGAWRRFFLVHRFHREQRDRGEEEAVLRRVFDFVGCPRSIRVAEQEADRLVNRPCGKKCRVRPTQKYL